MTVQAFKTAIAPYSKPVRNGLAGLRVLVLKIAETTPGVGRINEDLRWGQYSFLTKESGSGSTIRIDGLPNEENAFAMYFHCRSGLMDEFRELYGAKFKYDGRRALIFGTDDPLPKPELTHCITLALTHHLRKKPRVKKRSGNDTAHYHRHGPRPG